MDSYVHRIATRGNYICSSRLTRRMIGGEVARRALLALKPRCGSRDGSSRPPTNGSNNNDKGTSAASAAHGHGLPFLFLYSFLSSFFFFPLQKKLYLGPPCPTRLYHPSHFEPNSSCNVWVGGLDWVPDLKSGA